MTLHGATRLKIWLVLVGVFALGCVTGAALDGAYRTRATSPERRHARERGRHLEEMRRELNLSDEQAARLRAILDETGEEYRALRGELRPRFDAIRQRARARMREALSPEQQKRFDEMVARRDAKMNERHNEKKMRNDK
jgi:protein CpxP